MVYHPVCFVDSVDGRRIQSGFWAAMGFPVTDPVSRRHWYKLLGEARSSRERKDGWGERSLRNFWIWFPTFLGKTIETRWWWWWWCGKWLRVLGWVETTNPFLILLNYMIMVAQKGGHPFHSAAFWECKRLHLELSWWDGSGQLWYGHGFKPETQDAWTGYPWSHIYICIYIYVYIYMYIYIHSIQTYHSSIL